MKSIRTCIVCKNKFQKQNLHRVVSTQNGVVLDTNQKHQSRGIYLCSNNSCHLKLYKAKALNRAFKKNVSEQEYQNILNSISEKGK